MMFAGLTHLRSALHGRSTAIKNILVVDGHPDPAAARYCAALCEAYTLGARSAGLATRRLDIGALTPLDDGRAAKVFEHIWWADRVFVAFPMWLGGPPPALHLVFDEFARHQSSEAALLGVPLESKGAHIVVTASLPGMIYRTRIGLPVGGWATLPGLHVVHACVIGSMESVSQEIRDRWLSDVRRLGASPR